MKSGRKNEREARLKARKVAVAFLAIFANFAMLYVLKYWDATARLLDRLLPWASPPVFDLLIPLGVSFYIFQSVGYVVDVYRGKYEPERNVGKFALFVSFFPQIVQGPIGRFDHLARQLTGGRALDYSNIKFGIQLAMWGYFKKLVISGRAGAVVNTVFADSGAYSGSVIAFSVLFYCIQLYCDFSGGIDISRGVAKMFGIEMAENFRRPIFADSLTDFWRRWHISLGAWMRDYLFYPLSLSKPFRRLGKFARAHIGGTVGKILPTSLATFVVYFVIGIWHGANFRYIAFGFWNGAIITSSLLLAGFYAGARRRLGIADASRGLHVFRVLRTAGLVFIGRYITRAPRLKVAVAMLFSTFSHFQIADLFNGTLLTLGLTPSGLATVTIAMLVVLAVEWFQERGGQVRSSLERQNFFVQWLAILVPLFVIVFFGVVNKDYI